MIIAKQIDNLFYVYDVSKRQLYCLNAKLAKQFLAIIYENVERDINGNTECRLLREIGLI